MWRGNWGVWLSMSFLLSGCVAPQYVDWKILEAKVEKFEERLKTVEVLSLSTDTRLRELPALLAEEQKKLQEMEQRIQAEQVAMRQQLTELQKQMQDLREVGVIRKVILQGTVFFEPGKATLSQEARATLDKLGTDLMLQNFFNLEISGHADQEGSEGKTLALSKQRAETVAEYLIRNFSLDRHKISVEGFGDEYPLAPRTTEEGKMKNRRVEVKAFSLSPP